MPLRRHGTSRRSGLRRQQPDAPDPSPARHDRSAVASSSRSTPTRSRIRTHETSSSPKGSGRATLGDLLSSSHPIRTNKKVAKHVIELLDSSDDDTGPVIHPQPRHKTPPVDLDDVVTPELPPADADAPELSDDLEQLATAPQSPAIDVTMEADAIVDSTEAQLDVVQTQPPLSPPEPPPDPLANQRPIFDREELDMQINALMTRFDTQDASDSEHDDEDYEERRQRKLRENDVLLAMLGLAPSGSKPTSHEPATADPEDDDDDPEADDELAPMDDASPRKRGRPKKRTRDDSARPSEAADESRSNKKKKYDRKVKFAEDGTTKSAPLRGETFELAYVDVPALRDRARNDYVYIRDVPDIRPEDLITWSEDEEEEEDDDDEGDEEAHAAARGGSHAVTEDAEVLGIDSLGRRITKRRRNQPDVLPDGTVLTTCHQCRRKTPSAKMRCRRMRQGDQCTLMYCERCITVRYENDFNPSDVNFHCPRCLGYCNCSLCLRRSGFGDIVHKGRHRVLALTEELRKLAGQHGAESVNDRVGAILAENAALDMELPTPEKGSKANGKAVKKKSTKSDASTLGPPKRRGRPRKNPEAAPPWTPVKLDLNLSDEVAEGEVFSQLEEYTLGRLNVARRVLKLVASKQAAKPKAEPPKKAKARLVVRLHVPSRKSESAGASAVLAGAETKKKIPNYHDREKDVWVRSAADYSTSESEFGSEVDELADEDTDDDEAEDPDEAVFEEGRTQVFSRSYVKPNGIASTVASRGSSPLTSMDDGSSNASVASSPYDDQAKDLSQQASSGEEPETSTQGSVAAAFPASSLGMPQDMQQLALAVLEDPDRHAKAMHAGVLQLQDSPAFPTSSGSEAGHLAALLDPEPAAGTPVLFAESAYADL